MRTAMRSVSWKMSSGSASPRGTLVVLAGGGGRLTPEQHKRAFSVLSNTRLLDWKQWGSSLGGTLIVDDASYKEDVQRVGGSEGSPAAQSAGRQPTGQCALWVWPCLHGLNGRSITSSYHQMLPCRQ